MPVFFVQARDDPDLRPLQDVLDRNHTLRDRHLLRTFHDMRRGYCSARGDRSKARVAAAVATTLVSAADFFLEVIRFPEAVVKAAQIADWKCACDAVKRAEASQAAANAAAANRPLPPWVPPTIDPPSDDEAAP